MNRLNPRVSGLTIESDWKLLSDDIPRLARVREEAVIEPARHDDLFPIAARNTFGSETRFFRRACARIRRSVSLSYFPLYPTAIKYIPLYPIAPDREQNCGKLMGAARPLNLASKYGNILPC